MEENKFKKINNNCFLWINKGMLIDLEQLMIIVEKDLKNY